MTGLPADNVRVQYYAGSNTYGSSCYADAAEAAAIMSQELGKPVRLAVEPAGRIRLGQLRPGASRGDSRRRRCQRQDRGLRVSGVGTRRHRRRKRPATPDAGIPQRGGGPGGAGDSWRRRGQGRCAEPGAGGVGQGAWTGAGTGAGVDGGLYQIRISQNDMYDIPNRRMLEHRVAGRGFLKIGALRAPLDPPYFFAQEGMIDELAHLAELDPYEFRKRNISHPRWLGVLKAAADAAKWTPRVAALDRHRQRDVVARPWDRARHAPPASRTRAIGSPTRPPSWTSR